MKTSVRFLFVVLGLSCFVAIANAQEFELDQDAIETVADAANQWATQNLDESVIAQLDQIDRDLVRSFFEKARAHFQSNYVVDLGQLKQAAQTALPILERYEETYPYAVWLKTRMDYFEVAEEFEKALPPPNKSVPSTEVRPPNPSPEKERIIWSEKLSDRPWPANAKPLVPKLKPVFASEKVPSELVWLAEVESSFDPRARSPVGAAGLFQLMPATAKRYGLRTWPLDQRNKPEESARAAAKYLRFLNDKFGDWRLALAAYNSGEGTVERLLKSRRTKSFEDIAAHLPAETQLYVPKVEATLMKREGLKLAQLGKAAAR